MIPIKLTLNGIYSYQTEQTIDFESLAKNHLFGIFGPVGSGKSTILEAISYALYGETERLNARDSRNYNMMNLKSNALSIDFTFRAGAANSETFRFAVRGKRDKKDFNTVRALEREAYKLENVGWVAIGCDTAEEIIGLSYDNFRRTIIIPQGKFQEFLQLGDADRTKMMKEVFKLDRYDLAGRTDVVDRKNSVDLENIRGRLAQIGDVDQAMIDVESQRREDLLSLRGRLERELEAIELSGKSFQDLKELLDKLEMHRVELEDLESRKSLHEQREQLIEQYEVCLKNFPDLLKQRQGLEKTMATRSRTIAHARKKSDDLIKQIEKAEIEFATVKRGFENRHELETQWKEYECTESILAIDAEFSSIDSQKMKSDRILADKKRALEAAQKEKKDAEVALKRSKAQLPDQKTLSETKAWFEKQESLQERINELKLAAREAHSEILGFAEEKKAVLLRSVLKEHTTGPDRQLPLSGFIALLKGKIKESKILTAHKQEEIDSLKKQEALEQFASKLKEGDPCPLCGSNHHPHAYTGRGVMVRITQLAGERKKIDRDAEVLQECVQDLMEINTKITSAQKALEKHSKEVKAKSRDLNEHKGRFTWKKYEGKTIAWINKELQRGVSVSENIEELESRLADLRSTADELNQEISEGKDDLHKLTSRSSELAGSRKTLRRQIKTLNDHQIDELTPAGIKNEIKVLKKTFEGIEIRYKDLQQSVESKKKDHTDTVASMEADQRLLDQEEVDDKALNRELRQRLKSTGLTSVEAVEQILAVDLDVKKAKNEVRLFREELASAQDHHKKLEVELAGREYDPKAHAEVKSKIQTEKQNLRQTNEEIGHRESKLTKLRTDLQNRTQLEASKLKLESRKENLATLKQLFRGGKFINYASRLYLENLCGIANQRFAQLTRQKLRLELREDNSFVIRDFLNDGKLRSVKTLSGGQTFQASLSLALSLVDNLQQFAKSDENFFFLDEGFGTLDKDSLQIVFDALKSLRKENRTVGVISHVEEMQQEIENYATVRLDPEIGSIVTLG
jgi:DNA repair protein SbcC/Rad50